MTSTLPMDWVWFVQIVILILIVAAALTLILVLVQYRRPVTHHVITHERNRSWDEVKAEIEERSPAKIEWRYHGTAEQRARDEEKGL